MINDLGKNKALGPNGFDIAFFQHCSSIVKRENIALFNDYHRISVFEKSLNATFISLIPKVVWEYDIKKFKPIILVRSEINSSRGTCLEGEKSHWQNY